jgi:carbon storage regulator CsrA
MLYITRKETEKIVIMNEVEVQIVRIDEDRVQIVITAPPDVPVQRFEVFKKIAEKKTE